MLTPVDIENREFKKKGFHGYDAIEVDEFLNEVLADYEKLYRDNAALKDKNAVAQETIDSYKAIEETMQSAIMAAQKTAEEIKSNAYDRAESIIKDAQIRANNTIVDAENQVRTLEKRFIELQSSMDTFKARMSTMLASYLQLLSNADESDFKYMPVMQVKEPERVKKQMPERTGDKNSSIIDELMKKQSRYDEVRKEPEQPKPEQPNDEQDSFNAEEKKADYEKKEAPVFKKETFDSTDDLSATQEVVIDLKDKSVERFDVFKDSI